MEEEGSLKKSELVNWYLKELESEIETEEDLILKKTLFEKVLQRLIHYVRPIILYARFTLYYARQWLVFCGVTQEMALLLSFKTFPCPLRPI